MDLMPKTKTQPNPEAFPDHHQRDRQGDSNPQPLSGSKKVKNRNHSRDNHGEGH